jgi:hypothetical protein
MMHQPIPREVELRHLERGRTGTMVLRLMVLVGAVTFFYTLVSDPALAWKSYVVNWSYFTSIALGGILVAVVTWIVKAKWNWAVRRIHHSFAAYLPIAFVLFIPMLLNLREDYFPWIEMMADDPVVQKKAAYLNVPFLVSRNLVGVLAACTAQELGLPFEKVHVTVMDTDLTPDGGPSTASRQTYVSGNAARLAARAMREQMQSVLAEKFDTHPDVIAFHEGLAYVDERRLAQMHGAELPVESANGSNGSTGRILPGSTRSISFADAVNALLAENRLPKIRYEYWAPQTQPLGTGGDTHFAFSYAVHASLVSVDTETGEVAVERVISAHDVGRAINPLSLLGQIEGGIVMGIGNALTENYIVEDGIPWTERLGQYKMPSIKMTPRMDSHIVEHPTADGPYGAKGVGEISSIPISPAITNAIYNAVGVRCLALPVDQDALLLAMRDGEKEIDGHWGQTGQW